MADIVYARMDEGRKRLLAILSGILVARHLKTAEDLFDNKPTEDRGPGRFGCSMG